MVRAVTAVRFPIPVKGIRMPSREMAGMVYSTLHTPITAGASLGCWEIHTPSRRPMAPDSRMACPDRRKCSRSRPRNQSQRSP